MLKKLKENVLNEMNKTVMADDGGAFIGYCNNYRIVAKMPILTLIRHNWRISQKYKKA